MWIRDKERWEREFYGVRKGEGDYSADFPSGLCERLSSWARMLAIKSCPLTGFMRNSATPSVALA